MGVRRKFEFCPLPAWGRVPAPTPGRTPITGAPPLTGCICVPPGKTTLPKLRVVPGDVLDVPPGNTTLPKLRCTAWPNTLLAKASERTTASAFMGTPLTELYTFGRQNGGTRPTANFRQRAPEIHVSRVGPRGYFFFGAGAGGVAGLGAAGAAAPGVLAAPGAAVPGLAWS